MMPPTSSSSVPPKTTARMNQKTPSFSFLSHLSSFSHSVYFFDLTMVLCIVHFSTTSHEPSIAAVKIQSTYRHVVRNLYRKISAVNSKAERLQRLIQRQETVDAVRSDDRERIKLNEALTGLLFRLDSVPGVYPTVRELRRSVSRRIVGLQEILDAVLNTRVEDWAEFLKDWDDVKLNPGTIWLREWRKKCVEREVGVYARESGRSNNMGTLNCAKEKSEY